MIAVIGGVKATVSIKMKPPERDIEKQKKQDEDALLAAGIDIGNLGWDEKTNSERILDAENLEESRFRQYYEGKIREQASQSYWDEVGFGSKDFGGYPVIENEDADIKTIISGCSYTVAKILGERMKSGEVAFISVVGEDALGLAAKCTLEKFGINVCKTKTIKGSTPVGVEIHNIIGDLQFCRENNELMEAISPQFIDDCEDLLSNAEAIFIDGSLNIETLNYISDKYAKNCKIFFDPGSVLGGTRFARSRLNCFCVMPGRMEAEAMTDRQILGLDQLAEVGKAFEERGIKRTVITLKGGGLYYKEGIKSGVIKPEKVLPSTCPAGAGDVISAELVYSLLRGYDFAKAAQSAMNAAAAYLDRTE